MGRKKHLGVKLTYQVIFVYLATPSNLLFSIMLVYFKRTGLWGRTFLKSVRETWSLTIGETQ